MQEHPDGLPSVTQRLNTGYGKVYVEINVRDGEPFAVFVRTGNSGDVTNSWCEALGKTISWGLRSGADPEDVAMKLLDIRTDRIQTDNGDDILSIPDAVGIAILRYLDDSVGQEIRYKYNHN